MVYCTTPQYATLRYATLYYIAGLPKINSDRKTNSENSAWIRSARPAKVRRKRSKTHSPRRPLS